jgi:hypothetical protein
MHLHSAVARKQVIRMPKRILLLVCWFALTPAHAHAGAKQILSEVPRTVARTADNMATFKNRNLAFRQWALVAAALANAGSGIDLYRRCATCTERDTFFYASRPSGGRLIGLSLLGGMGYSTVQQALWESSYGEDRSGTWRAVLRWAPTAAPIAGYTWCVVHNVRIPSDGSRN